MNPFDGAIPWAKIVQWAQSRESNAVSFDALGTAERNMITLVPMMLLEWQAMNPASAEPKIGDNNWVGLLQETIIKYRKEPPIFTDTEQRLQHGRKNGELLKWHVSLMLFDGYKFPCADYGYVDGKPYFFTKKKDAKQFACLNALRHIMDNNILPLQGRDKEDIYYASKALKSASSAPAVPPASDSVPRESLHMQREREDHLIQDPISSSSSSSTPTPAPIQRPQPTRPPVQQQQQPQQQPPPPVITHKRVMMGGSPETSPPPKKKSYEAPHTDPDTVLEAAPDRKSAARRKHPTDKLEEDRDIEERKRRVMDLCNKLRIEMPRFNSRSDRGKIDAALVIPKGSGVCFETTFSVTDKYDRKAAEQELWDMFVVEAERVLQRHQIKPDGV